jgi:hypothetical protein
MGHIEYQILDQQIQETIRLLDIRSMTQSMYQTTGYQTHKNYRLPSSGKYSGDKCTRSSFFF